MMVVGIVYPPISFRQYSLSKLTPASLQENIGKIVAGVPVHALRG